VGLLNLWRQARGSVLRKEYDDVVARMDGANEHARAAFLNNIAQTVDHVVQTYTAASPAERKRFMKAVNDKAREMWVSGDWPSALGLGISCLNAESRFVAGAAAAYVRAQTERLINEAQGKEPAA
jgi:hypothetical protein